MKDKKELLNKIEEFLKDRKPVIDGGWAEVTDDELIECDEIISLLLNLKWDLDFDGDRPVTPLLIDRTKYHPSPYTLVKVPHEVYNCNEREVDVVIRDLVSGARSMLNEVDIIHSMRWRRSLEAERENKEKEDGSN
jgi:hypothetical protein